MELDPPSKDDFYLPPKGYETSKPGDILKIRSPPSKLASNYIPIHIKQAWQILIRSEDSFGNPNTIVTTIIQPHNADPKKVISYQTYEDSANIDCSPSYGFLFGSSFATVATQTDMTLMVMALQRGYYVVSPDYEGPKSTFTVGRQSGQAVLNSIRAALKSGAFTGIDKDAKVAMWGYSGGSLASSWAASLQPEYAPDLGDALIGVALGGFVTNITATAEATDGTIFAGLIANALAGLANEYPDFKDRIYKLANPMHILPLSYGDKYFLVPSVMNYIGSRFFKGLWSVFPQGFGVLNDAIIGKVVKDNSLIYLAEDLMPRIPIFVYHGSLDSIVPIVGAKGIYDIWCQNNINSFEFAEDATTGHLAETIVGAPAAWTWIEQRFDGIEPVRGCSHVVRVSNFLYPGVESATLQYFKGLFDTFIHSPLGPYDKASTKSN
ncbi:uncharacterized protein J8A68_004034 [[Candida] subhashii]|uniref:Triacylglycerol lipase n=1 Tax=[Candida] subhashii TaxID=561895 RepID=A0A8J5QI56_9ASCO|nr:uncharacterized protein J8A68_004034 [[Candida] subhashii]KAG7662503.1 hypothetical protein J8A68_004034 [[Candida] subhashii]